MKGCFATLLLCYFLPMHVFRYNEAVAQILSDFCNGPFAISIRKGRYMTSPTFL